MSWVQNVFFRTLSCGKVKMDTSAVHCGMRVRSKTALKGLTKFVPSDFLATPFFQFVQPQTSVSHHYFLWRSILLGLPASFFIPLKSNSKLVIRVILVKPCSKFLAGLLFYFETRPKSLLRATEPHRICHGSGPQPFPGIPLHFISNFVPSCFIF